MNWVILGYVAAIVAAIGFFILCIGIVKTLREATVSLNLVNQTLSNTEKSIEGIAKETEILLAQTNTLLVDIQGKSQELNPVVVAVGQLGSSLQKFATSVDKVNTSVTKELQHSKGPILKASSISKRMITLVNSGKKLTSIKKKDVSKLKTKIK